MSVTISQTSPEKRNRLLYRVGIRNPTISKPHYWMAPTEMLEFKKKVQELEDLGFVWPSTSHWGAPVLFIKKKDGTSRLCIDYRDLISYKDQESFRRLIYV